MRAGLFKELVENSEDIHVVTDRDFRIRYISSSVARITGVEPVSLVGRNILDYVDREKLDSWKGRLRDASDQFNDELVLRTKGGVKSYFHVHASKIPVGKEVQGLVLKLNDITEKKLREEELIRSNQQLDQVIYKTTHDLKAPIMSALGLVRLAEQSLDVEKDHYIGLIKKSLLKLESFIEEMNTFYRIDKMAVQREKINVSELLAEEWEDLKNLYPENVIDIVWEIQESSELFSDRVRIKTIFTNILSNAIKYMDLQKQNPFIKIAASITNEFFDIDFEDNGIGIEPRYHEKIFDQFFRATDRSEGTGLGLFIVKDTVERLKGSIGVRSKAGEGTVFRIRIPNQLRPRMVVE